MNFRAVDIADLIPRDLPDGREIVAEGKALGQTVEMGLSLYCEEKGVDMVKLALHFADARLAPTAMVNLSNNRLRLLQQTTIYHFNLV